MWGQHCSGCSATKRPKTTSQSRRNLTERKRYRIVGWATATPRWATWSWLWMPTPGPTRWAAKKCTRKKEIGWKLSSTPRKASSPSSLVDNGHCILIDIDRQPVVISLTQQPEVLTWVLLIWKIDFFFPLLFEKDFKIIQAPEFHIGGLYLQSL